MREIKFRAWDKTNLQMVYEWGYYTDQSNIQHVVNDEGEKIPGIVMQFTGLLDRNGREIYDGDIVQVKRQCAFIYEDFLAKGIVRHGEHGVGYGSDMAITKPAFGWYIESIESPRNEYDTDKGKSMIGEYVYFSKKGNPNIEVIGNVHENPELIK